MLEGVDFSKLSRTEKYKYLVTVLEKVETNLLFEGKVIDGDKELEEQRTKDVEYMNNLISEELINDNIKKMFVKGRIIRPIDKTS